MIKRSFEVCGITSSGPNKIRSDAFLPDFIKMIDITDELKDNDDNIFLIFVYSWSIN